MRSPPSPCDVDRLTRSLDRLHSSCVVALRVAGRRRPAEERHVWQVPASSRASCRDCCRAAARMPGAYGSSAIVDEAQSGRDVGRHEAPATSSGDRRAGGVSRRRAAAGPLPVEAALDGFETAVRRVVLEAGQTAAIDVTLSPARFSAVGGRDRPARRGSRAGSADSGVGGERRPRRRRRRLQREPPEGADSRRCSSTRPTRATRRSTSAASARRSGSPTTASSRASASTSTASSTRVPPSATLDFLDVEQVEVLRGPQGTLFGKNTTAGAINVTTRKPSFTPDTEVELNYGNLGFVQAKASITGPLCQERRRARCRSPARSATARVYNTETQRRRERPEQPRRARPGAVRAVGQARDHRGGRPHAPARRRATRRSSPASRRRCAPPNRQYPQIAADLGYTPPSFNAFDRLTDIDTPLRSYQDLGGASLNVDWKLGPGRLTSTTAWRYWDWNPSNDRDFIGLPVTTISAGTVEAAAVDAGGPLRRRRVAAA